MKWIKKKCFYSVLLFLGFLSLLSVVSLLTVNDTFAVADVSYSIDSSNYSSSLSICSSSSVSCSDYSYILIENDFNSVNSINCKFQFNFNTSGSSAPYTFYPFLSSSYLMSISDPVVSIFYISFSNVSQCGSGWSVNVTLSENNPFSSGITPSGSLSITENGTYDVTNYAEAVVDVPTSSGVADGGTDVSEIVKALYTLGGVILVVYFFYCIYRMIIKPLRS